MCSRSPLGGSTGSQSMAILSSASSRRSRPFFKRSWRNLRIDTAAVTMIQLGSVNGDGVLDLLEEVFVVDDVTEVLVVTVEPVGAANCLKQAMILHALVDVKVGAGRRVES